MKIRVQVTDNQKQKRRSELRVLKSRPGAGKQFDLKKVFIGSILASPLFPPIVLVLDLDGCRSKAAATFASL